MTTGHDNCQAGLLCLNSECRPACRASPSTCGTGFACQRYNGFDDGSGNLGLCEPTCDPVTQIRDFDGAAACGSPNPAVPTRGCYGAPGSAAQPTQFTCLPAGDAAKTHRAPAADASGTVYLNGCAPGYAPLLFRSSADPTLVCIALCSPAEVYSGSLTPAQGVSPHTCPARGAVALTEECRHFWFLEAADAPASSYSNAVGFCLDTNQYTFDPDGTGPNPAVPFPSCTTLPNSDSNGDGVAEHLFFGCAPLP
jgi:hypothetical protein